MYNEPSPEALREAAARAREAATVAEQTSEYPRHGKACHLRLADALDAQADTVEATTDAIGTTTGNRREDRRARRVARLNLRAAAKRVEAARLSAESHDIGSRIPFGQPILIGHHSEGRHRRTIERMHRKDDRAAELRQEAADAAHAAKAAERNQAVYADDPDAIAKLRHKLARLEESREHWKGLNAEYRRCKKDIDAMDISDELKARFESERRRWFMGSDAWKPTAGYALSNVGAEIRRLRQRIEDLEERETISARPDRTIGDVVVRDNLDYHKVELHFPGKPDENVRRELKRLGFRWIRSAGCWARSIGNDTEWRLEQIAKILGVELKGGE